MRTPRVRPMGVRNLAMPVAVMATGLSVAFGSVAGAQTASEDTEADTPSNITITQTPSGEDGPCLPPALALRQTVRNDEATFRLIVTASAPLCDPVDASAVIYSMPDNGDVWPQTLSEKVDFTISDAGTTEIEFTKDCNPVQFDVITGAAPQVISPTGDKHGPLLFPLDTGTTLQFPGLDDESCTQPTTTSTSTTTSTTEPEILGSTTVPEVQPSSEVPVEVHKTMPTRGRSAHCRPTKSATSAI